MASLRRWVPTSSRFNQNCRVAICVWLSSPSLWSPAAASAASTASMGTTNSPFATCSGAVRGTACLGPNRSSRDGTRRQTLFALVSEPNEAREGGFFARATPPQELLPIKMPFPCKVPRQGTNSVVAASSRARTSLGRPPRAAARALPYSEPNGTLRSAASLWTVRRVFRSGSADGVAWARGITLGGGGGGGGKRATHWRCREPAGAPHLQQGFPRGGCDQGSKV